MDEETLPEIAVEPTLADGTSRFINRELSWLAFNARVVAAADNPRYPLLERLRFVSISASNLDEFYSVRVAGLIGQARAGVALRSSDGLTPTQQLAEINRCARTLMETQQRVLGSVLAELAGAGLTVIAPHELNEADRAFLDQHFMERVFPVLTPLAIDPAHPFPFVQNMGLVLALKLIRQDDSGVMRALIPLPAQIRRFIRLPDPRRPRSASSSSRIW
ncbi:unnamed protein product [Acidocella sp. C78]|nr:unnamed protein product [Acidocella sp. C78]